MVVLPFENDTSEKDINVLARKSFYNHFSSKNYRDLELSEVDGVLETLEVTTSQTGCPSVWAGAQTESNKTFSPGRGLVKI